MKILYYGLNFSPEITGIGKYSGEMAGWFADQGCDVHVITAPPYYPEWKVHRGFRNFYSYERTKRLGVIRCPIFIPTNPSTLKRILHLISFSISSVLPLMWHLRSRPDVVVTVQPTLFCAPFALLYGRLSGAKVVLHIQDFELDAMLGLQMIKGGIFTRFATKIEKWLLKRFDAVSTISLSMMENAANKGVVRQNLFFFPNWADTEFVTPEVSGRELRSKWGFSPDDKIVLYSGNIGKKQGLDVILDAAEAFKSDSNVKFLIIGSGANLDLIRQEAKAKKLSNVIFKPLQPWELVPQVLSMADVHLVVQRRGAADVVLPSKLTNILSSGGYALVTAELDTELGRLSQKYPGIYQIVQPENSVLFVSELKNLLSQNLTGFNSIARCYALENLSKQNVLFRFKNDLLNLCGNPRFKKNTGLSDD